MFKLSITGADNLVDVNQLKNLVNQYPDLELAILYFPEKENINRNPGFIWRLNFFDNIPKNNTAIHLCGEKVFNIILSNEFETTLLFKELQKTQRIQININARKDIFNNEDIHKIYKKLLSHGFEIILQYHERSKFWILPFLNDNASNKIHILLDSSLGKGIAPEKFTIPEELIQFNLPIGFAGGLNPQNIDVIHEQIKLFNLANYWLDLESGVRTDNNFDMHKAQLLCEKVL